MNGVGASREDDPDMSSRAMTARRGDRKSGAGPVWRAAIATEVVQGFGVNPGLGD